MEVTEIILQGKEQKEAKKKRKEKQLRLNTEYMTLSKYSEQSGPQFSNLWNEDSSICLPQLTRFCEN